MTSIAPAIVKLMEAHRDRRVSVQRCAEQVARHLDTAGDTVGATAVREAAKKQPEPMAMAIATGQVHGPVEWLQPMDLSNDLVLDSATGASLSRLADELAAAPRIVAAGLDAPTRAMLIGPSGTGKTMAVRWLGGRLGLPVALVRLDRVASSYMGETAKSLAKAFEDAASCPSIVFLDELDGMCSRRDRQTDVGEALRITSSLLQQLDLLPAVQIVIGATNFREAMDPALVRRLPSEVTFGLPDARARETMVRRWWERVPHDGDAVRAVVTASAGRSGAETRALAMAAGRAAMLTNIPIEASHVEAARKSAT